MEILIPILAVTVIGLICAVGLAVASSVMAVKEDTRFTEIRACLPGANCGACGYTGCDGYAKALLEDFLTRADRAVEGGAVSADLRFGHDGNLMTFVSLLQFEGCDVVESDPEKIAQMWPLYRISPMAANIQLVFYRKKASDDVLVKFLYNEREVRIPVASDLAPYYRWNDVRDFYRNVMENLPDPAGK